MVNLSWAGQERLHTEMCFQVASSCIFVHSVHAYAYGEVQSTLEKLPAGTVTTHFRRCAACVFLRTRTA